MSDEIKVLKRNGWVLGKVKAKKYITRKSYTITFGKIEGAVRVDAVNDSAPIIVLAHYLNPRNFKYTQIDGEQRLHIRSSTIDIILPKEGKLVYFNDINKKTAYFDITLNRIVPTFDIPYLGLFSPKDIKSIIQEHTDKNELNKYFYEKTDNSLGFVNTTMAVKNQKTGESYDGTMVPFTDCKFYNLHTYDEVASAVVSARQTKLVNGYEQVTNYTTLYYGVGHRTYGNEQKPLEASGINNKYTALYNLCNSIKAYLKASKENLVVQEKQNSQKKTVADTPYETENTVSKGKLTRIQNEEDVRSILDSHMSKTKTVANEHSIEARVLTPTTETKATHEKPLTPTTNSTNNQKTENKSNLFKMKGIISASFLNSWSTKNHEGPIKKEKRLIEVYTKKHVRFHGPEGSYKEVKNTSFDEALEGYKRYLLDLNSAEIIYGENPDMVFHTKDTYGVARKATYTYKDFNWVNYKEAKPDVLSKVNTASRKNITQQKQLPSTNTKQKKGYEGLIHVSAKALLKFYPSNRKVVVYNGKKHRFEVIYPSRSTLRKYHTGIISNTNQYYKKLKKHASKKQLTDNKVLVQYVINHTEKTFGTEQATLKGKNIFYTRRAGVYNIHFNRYYKGRDSYNGKLYRIKDYSPAFIKFDVKTKKITNELGETEVVVDREKSGYLTLPREVGPQVNYPIEQIQYMRDIFKSRFNRAKVKLSEKSSSTDSKNQKYALHSKSSSSNLASYQ